MKSNQGNLGLFAPLHLTASTADTFPLSIHFIWKEPLHRECSGIVSESLSRAVQGYSILSSCETTQMFPYQHAVALSLLRNLFGLKRE